MPSSPEDMAAAMIANMKDKTGKTLTQWLAVVRKAKLEKHGQIVKRLKTEHGMTHGFANLVAHKALEGDSGPAGAADLVAAQYSGAKADLVPIYEAVVTAVAKFGPDVTIAPKKTYVSLRRSKQFALIRPSTKTRVDLGINLKGEPAKGRLEASGSFNAMVSHRVRLSAEDEVNTELLAWLRQAYEAS